MRDYIRKRYCRHILINTRKSTSEAGGDRKEQTINKARENVKLCVWGGDCAERSLLSTSIFLMC